MPTRLRVVATPPGVPGSGVNPRPRRPTAAGPVQIGQVNVSTIRKVTAMVLAAYTAWSAV